MVSREVPGGDRDSQLPWRLPCEQSVHLEDQAREATTDSDHHPGDLPARGRQVWRRSRHEEIKYGFTPRPCVDHSYILVVKDLIVARSV